MQLLSITKLSVYSVAVVSTLGVSVNALGINCQGSSLCAGWTSDTAQRLNSYIQGISNNAWYNNGQKIACAKLSSSGGDGDGICAFLQNTGGANGAKIKQLAPYIRGHGCTRCGSVPYYYPEGNNNVADGQLTFNYVSNACNTSGNGGLC